jgi:type III restriction enzyme
LDVAKIGVRFYYADDADKKLAQSRFVSSFASFYRGYIEKNYFDLDFRPIVKEDAQPLKQRFADTEIFVPADQENSTSWKRVTDPQKLKQFIDQGYQFYGFNKSIYDYVKFDTFPEKQFADYAERVLASGNGVRAPFWVRNNRNVWFYYGTRRYYPDFLMLRDGTIYVLETKGELYSDTRKNLLLEHLKTLDGYDGVLIYSDFMNKTAIDTPFEEFLEAAALDAEKRHGKERLLENVEPEDQFVRFLPAYKPESAYRKFVKRQAKVRIEGWLEVPVVPEQYSENSFVTQMKGNAMSPELSHNEWAIFEWGVPANSATGRVVIFHHHQIDDENFGDKGVTIRKFRFNKEKSTNSLFETVTVILEAVSADHPPIELRNITSDSQIEIVGTMAQLV